MVSVDTLEDNKAFAEKEQADFPMLADPEKKVAFAYGSSRQTRRPIGSSRDAGPSTSIRPARSPSSTRPSSPQTAGQDIVAKLAELNVPKRK